MTTKDEGAKTARKKRIVTPVGVRVARAIEMSPDAPSEDLAQMTGSAVLAVERLKAVRQFDEDGFQQVLDGNVTIAQAFKTMDLPEALREAVENIVTTFGHGLVVRAIEAAKLGFAAPELDGDDGGGPDDPDGGMQGAL